MLQGSELHRRFGSLLMERALPKWRKTINLSSGNPLSRPFSPALAAAKASMDDYQLSIYGNPYGSPLVRESLIHFCDFANAAPSQGGFSSDNILLGAGSTHLYSCALEALAQRAKTEQSGKKPVLLMTSPTYGLFSLHPEPFDFDTETVELKKEHGWSLDSDDLEKKIREINASADRKVIAFYRVNPHNPLGVVQGYEETKKISQVLKRNDVFGIDDAAYYGQELAEQAVPLTHFDLDNAVTLYSLSKTYCMPQIRGGFMVGSKTIVEETAHAVLRTIQSVPRTAEAALQATFCKEAKWERESYAQENNAEYKRRFNVLNAVMNGMAAINDNVGMEERRSIQDTIERVFANRRHVEQILSQGIEGVEVINPNLSSGYFAVLKFDGLEESYYGTQPIVNTFQLAAACIDEGNTLALPMQSALASNQDHGHLRVTFGVTPDSIVKGLRGIFYAKQALCEKPNPELQRQLDAQGLALNDAFDF